MEKAEERVVGRVPASSPFSKWAHDMVFLAFGLGIVTLLVGGITAVKSANGSSPLDKLAHHMYAEEVSPKGDHSWTCRVCNIRFTSKDDPVDPNRRLVGLTSLERKGYNTQWRSVPGQKTELHRLFAIDGVMAAEFTAGPTKQVMWDDLGTISLEPVDPPTQKSQRMLKIFRWIE